MPVLLPTGPVSAQRQDPKVLMLYGRPKVGKTEMLSQLPDCLIVDTEKGTELSDNVVAVQANNFSEYYEVLKALDERVKQQNAAGNPSKFAYDTIAIDTLDMLEDFAEIASTIKYKQTTIGKTFEGSSVLELPKGSGYYHLREELKLMVQKMGERCRRLILISHVKDKIILSKEGTELTVTDVSLTGKLGAIMTAKADAIGYMYRDANGKLMVSFQTFEEGGTMGSRCKHLVGKVMPFQWDSIYIDNNNKQVTNG